MKRGIDYIGIGIGVGALITNEQNECLLMLRKVAPEANKWAIPGGGVEIFETLENAVKRECLEEIGVEVEIDKLLTIVDHILSDEKCHWVAAEFSAVIASGAPTNMEPHKCHEIRWFPLDRLPISITITTAKAITAYKESKR